jgi:hypothetical protein
VPARVQLVLPIVIACYYFWPYCAHCVITYCTSPATKSASIVLRRVLLFEFHAQAAHISQRRLRCAFPLAQSAANVAALRVRSGFYSSPAPLSRSGRAVSAHTLGRNLSAQAQRIVGVGRSMGFRAHVVFGV